MTKSRLSSRTCGRIGRGCNKPLGFWDAYFICCQIMHWETTSYTSWCIVGRKKFPDKRFHILVILACPPMGALWNSFSNNPLKWEEGHTKIFPHLNERGSQKLKLEASSGKLIIVLTTTGTWDSMPNPFLNHQGKKNFGTNNIQQEVDWISRGQERAFEIMFVFLDLY